MNDWHVEYPVGALFAFFGLDDLCFSRGCFVLLRRKKGTCPNIGSDEYVVWLMLDVPFVIAMVWRMYSLRPDARGSSGYGIGRFFLL